MTPSLSEAAPRGDAFTTPVPPRSDALPPGTRLDEYEIGPLLGESPIGIVYLATDRSLDRMVAIREYLPIALAGRGDGQVVALRSAGLSDAYRRGLRAFVEEGRLLARFDHPSLLRVLRFWEANYSAYMVMPFYDAPTLVESRQRLQGPPAEDWVRGVIDSLAGALELLHERSCLHRRVSPMRVRMLRDGRPVLLGPSAVRQVLGEAAQAAMVQPGYSAIEEYAESTELPQGPWTDVYSLGALARYCILGTTPTAAAVRSVRDTLVPMAEAVAPLRAERPELQYSASLMAAIDRALAVDPKHRPPSIAHFRMLLASGTAMAPPHSVSTSAASATTASSASAATSAATATAAAPTGETTEPDPDTTQWQASLSAMVDAAIADAPPMRTSGPAAAPEVSPAAPQASASSSIEESLFQRAAARRAQNEAMDHVLGTVPGQQHEAAPEVDLQFDALSPQDELSTISDRGGAAPPLQRPFWLRKPFGAAMATLALAAVAYFGWTNYRQFQTDKLLATQAQMPTTAVVAERPRVTETAPSASVAAAARNASSPSPAEAASQAALTALPSAPTSAGTSNADRPTASTSATPPAPEPATPSAVIAAARAPFAVLEPVKSADEPQPAAATPRGRARGEPRETRPDARVEQEPPAPRTACGSRTAFSLYYCMKQQCDKPQFMQHVQCKQLRLHDTVD